MGADRWVRKEGVAWMGSAPPGGAACRGHAQDTPCFLPATVQPPGVGCRWRLGGWGWITGGSGPVGPDIAKATGTSSRPAHAWDESVHVGLERAAPLGGWDAYSVVSNSAAP